MNLIGKENQNKILLKMRVVRMLKILMEKLLSLQMLLETQYIKGLIWPVC